MTACLTVCLTASSDCLVVPILTPRPTSPEIWPPPVPFHSQEVAPAGYGAVCLTSPPSGLVPQSGGGTRGLRRCLCRGLGWIFRLSGRSRPRSLRAVPGLRPAADILQA